jgi:hypothetical protein
MARNQLPGICQIWGKFRVYHQLNRVQIISIYVVIFYIKLQPQHVDAHAIQLLMT